MSSDTHKFEPRETRNVFYGRSVEVCAKCGRYEGHPTHVEVQVRQQVKRLELGTAILAADSEGGDYD